jgi:electron transfer flavoprotein beta subunit
MDYTTHIRVKADGSGVEITHAKMIINPFDEIAVEEAIRLKEKNIATEIVVLSIGNNQCQETIRTALAMGADKGILVECQEDIQPLAVAKIIKEIALKESPQLIILGKQSIDNDYNQTGQMLAGLLNWPQGTFASKITIEDNKVRVVREIDGGLETCLLKLPAVITTDLRLNEPRYLSLPNIVQAKRKPISIIPLAELKKDISSKLHVLIVNEPGKRRVGTRVDTVAELVAKLRHESQVIT